MPIYGPFNKTVNYGPSGRDGQHIATWYRQKPPYTARLPYTVFRSWIDPVTNKSVYTNAASWNFDPWTDPDAQKALSKSIERARNRLNEDLGSNASIGVTLAEWRQSLNMIETRSLQLYQFTRALRKGRLGEAASALSLDPSARRPRKRLARGKTFGNSYLEWHFGWAPLVADIGDAIDVLQAPVPLNTVRGRASLPFDFRRGPPINLGGEIIDGRCRVQLLTEVSVSNPNLYLANKLGFVNPAVVAWELIPFSFLVDWFVPVGNFLSQWTDFVGLNLSNPATTTLFESRHRQRINDGPPYGFRIQAKSRLDMKRVSGIASYELAPNRVTGLSASRGLTAVSLLLQSLKG